MKKDILTILGCSGSLAIALMIGNGAKANTLPSTNKEFVFTAPSAEAVVSEVEEEFGKVDCGCSSNGADNWTEADSEKAIAMFGCDCAGCQRIARSMASEGTLAQ